MSKTKPKAFSTLILCDYLLSMAKEDGEIKREQMIIIQDGEVLSIGPVPQKLPPAQEVIDLKNHLVCPGLINTHTHLPMTLFRGLGDHLTLKDWLEKVIFPLEKKMINPEFVRIGTELAILELIKGGTTTVSDMYFHTPQMASVIEKYGLRAILAVDALGLYSNWQEELDFLCNTYQKKPNPRIYPAIACHAPYTCSPEVLSRSALEAQKRDISISIHVAETKWEMAEIKKKYGKTPVQHLKDLGVIGPKTLFVHGVHITEEDLSLMAKTKTPLSYNPESNMKLASGVAPILRAMDKGITIGLGTDGSASNNNLNLWQEMDTATKLQKLNQCIGGQLLPAGQTGLNGDIDHAPILSQKVFSWVTSSAAKALGLEPFIGKIAPGFKADIIALNLDYPHFYPRHDLLNHLVYSAHGGEVDFVMCQGKTLMQGGEILGVDTARIYKEAEQIRSQIKL